MLIITSCFKIDGDDEKYDIIYMLIITLYASCLRTESFLGLQLSKELFIDLGNCFLF